MKQKKSPFSLPNVWAFVGYAALMLLVIFFLNRVAFYIAATVTLPFLFFFSIRQIRFHRYIRQYLTKLTDLFIQNKRESLQDVPMPIALVSCNDELLWYNDLFRTEILHEADAYGKALSSVFDGLSIEKITNRFLSKVFSKNKTFSLYTEAVSFDNEQGYLLYCADITELNNISNEYFASRPIVLSLFVDNGEEVLQNLRESDRARLISQVEAILEDWIGTYNGVLKKCGTYRYIALIEQRDLEQIEVHRFTVLDTVRALPTETENVTLSVGVGKGKTFAQAEEQSRQALDMALGRGGDQAAVKTKNGFDFYGGISKSVEKRTKVRPRVIASALQEIIQNSDNVVLMGHRYSDLDCLGSAAALACVCRNMGKSAYVVYDPKTTLAKALINRFSLQGKDDVFVEIADVVPLITDNTLLIITDIHQPSRLDFPELYQKAKQVVVIDHHRKMVEHIDNALLFYHEPYASSAAEMTAEVIQYMSNVKLPRLEAEALLAGIMLDTRQFVMKAGVRTFEAAAFLRKSGADTIAVKCMFSEDMSMYQTKAEIMATAKLVDNTAIACANIDGENLRIAAAQAADELMSVRNVDASFVLFSENGGVNISARSFGTVNVQLIMEAMGGGGHQTMAGAFLKECTLSEAENRLCQVISSYKKENHKER